MPPRLQSKLPDSGTTMFTVMSSLAAKHDAVNLGQGFPDYVMPEELINLVTAAIQNNYNQYTHMAGYPPLRDILAEKIKNCANKLNQMQRQIRKETIFLMAKLWLVRKSNRLVIEG